MEIRSLGLRTDLMFHRFEGEVEDLGDLVAVRTPSNPGYRWGNLLVFPGPPGPGDRARWEDLFGRHVSERHGSDLGHRTFTWDVPPGDADPRVPLRGAADAFTAAGYRLELSETLAAGPEDLRAPPRPAEGLEVRPVRTDEEREAILEIQTANLAAELGEPREGVRAFLEAKRRMYDRLREAGRGEWWGGWLRGEAVASMGLYFDEGSDAPVLEGGGRLGRFQGVDVAAHARRRGVAGTMVHALARRAFEEGADRLVLIADADGPAHRLYKALGFAHVETTAGLELHPLPSARPSGG